MTREEIKDLIKYTYQCPLNECKGRNHTVIAISSYNRTCGNCGMITDKQLYQNTHVGLYESISNLCDSFCNIHCLREFIFNHQSELLDSFVSNEKET
jgi:hypothetical protein